MPGHEKAVAQVGPETIRPSIRLDKEADLIADLKQALNRLGRTLRWLRWA